jgi:hypothetical protein
VAGYTGDPADVSSIHGMDRGFQDFIGLGNIWID